MDTPVVKPTQDSNTPETTSTKVTFSSEQKQVISTLIRERVIDAQKAHAKEIAELKASLAQPPEEAASKEIAQLKYDKYLLEKQLRLNDIISEVEFKDNVAVRKLTIDQVEYNQEKGTWSARSESGKVYTNLSVFYEDFASEHPYLAGRPTSSAERSSSSTGRAVVRDAMSDAEKSQYIKAHGQLAFLALPKK